VSVQAALDRALATAIADAPPPITRARALARTTAWRLILDMGVTLRGDPAPNGTGMVTF
jgi:hypothetical protein